MTWVVIGTGESVSPALMARVRHLPCIAVNDAYKDAPWARALVANDPVWWRHNGGAPGFAGEKWCGSMARDKNHARYDDVMIMARGTCVGSQTNSGLRALDWAIRHYEANRVLLLGIDLIGKHYHGDHPAPLGNPNEARFQLFRAQFEAYAAEMPTSVEVINCSPISTVQCFAKRSIDEVLEEAEIA